MPAALAHAELLRHRSEFPLLSRVTYLNTCSLGARSERSRRRLETMLDQWDSLGARAWYRHWLSELDGLRNDLGWAVGVVGAEIALAPNVSTALAVVASTLDPVHRGDSTALRALAAAGVPAGTTARPRIITTELDFPTLGHQWLARAPLGVEVTVLRSPDGIGVPLEMFADAIDDRTALVATAHVYFTTGAVQDVAGLAALAHARGALLLIDAYQATGLIPTDLAASEIDLYVSGTLKWLFGGSGTAFVWMRPALWKALRPTTTGWFSQARQFAFDIEHLEFAADARRYELGTPSVPSAVIARGGLELVREIGIEPIRDRTVALGQLLIGEAESAGLRVRTVRDPAGRGGIIAFEVTEPKPVVDALADLGIVVDYRPGIIRCSPAFYNTEDEVAETVAALDRLVPAPDRR
jgi:selenocysteine lyase/cysteine desulfurase